MKKIFFLLAGGGLLSLLSASVYPTAFAVELGPDDFQISQTPGDGNFDASFPDVAYNSKDKQYLAVWAGRTSNSGDEIFGQRIDAATGNPIGSNFPISQMGPEGNLNLRGTEPIVAYNSTDNQFLVVWYGDAVTDGENEVHGQRLDAGGNPIGGNFKISQMGLDGDIDFDAVNAMVAYNSKDNRFLVVWEGNENDVLNIFIQQLNADGSKFGSDAKISNPGPGGSDLETRRPAVAYNSTDNQYLVIWDADSNLDTAVEGKRQIIGQRLDAASGGELGSDFLVSNMSPGNDNIDAIFSAVVYNSVNNEYLAVWQGDMGGTDAGPQENEIFGQRIRANGSENGSDFRISRAGPEGNVEFRVSEPHVEHNSVDNQYLVIWWGDFDNETDSEIVGRRLDAATGNDIGSDFRISTMGGPGAPAGFNAEQNSLAYSPDQNQYLAVWEGEVSATKFEIFGQRLGDAVCGNGVVEAEAGGEACDDGNASAGDCCGATCQFEPSGSACDDGNPATANDQCNDSGVCGGAPSSSGGSSGCALNSSGQTGFVFSSWLWLLLSAGMVLSRLRSRIFTLRVCRRSPST
jgi:cysteine-rich repeat protein